MELSEKSTHSSGKRFIGTTHWSSLLGEMGNFFWQFIIMVRIVTSGGKIFTKFFLSITPFGRSTGLTRDSFKD